MLTFAHEKMDGRDSGDINSPPSHFGNTVDHAGRHHNTLQQRGARWSRVSKAKNGVVWYRPAIMKSIPAFILSHADWRKYEWRQKQGELGFGQSIERVARFRGDGVIFFMIISSVGAFISCCVRLPIRVELSKSRQTPFWSR